MMLLPLSLSASGLDPRGARNSPRLRPPEDGTDAAADLVFRLFLGLVGCAALHLVVRQLDEDGVRRIAHYRLHLRDSADVITRVEQRECL